MPYKKLSIPKPCDQPWEKMKKNEKGSYCSSCNTTIIDFSDLSDAELIKVLQSGKYHCGRFDEDQMGIIYYLEEKKNERKKYWNSIAAALVAGVLQISSGFTQTDQAPQKPHLYSRSIAFDKYFVQPEEKNEETDTLSIKENTNSNRITFVFENKKHKTPVKNVSIKIKELKFTGTSDEHGEITIELNPSLQLEQVIELEIEENIMHFKGRGNKGYRGKSIFLELNKLVNEEKTIYLNVLTGHKRRGHRKYMMGVYR